jgi:hypothetical protein
VVSVDPIIRVLLEGLQRRGDQLVQDPRVDRGAVSRDFDWDRARTQSPGKEAPGAARSRLADSTTSMTRPC